MGKFEGRENLYKFYKKKIKVYTIQGEVIIGDFTLYTSAGDNDPDPEMISLDRGRDYVDIETSDIINIEIVEWTVKIINVFQSELNKYIPLEYVGKVKYVGESFGVDSLTDGEVYDVVRDKNETLKIVDDSGKDYIYNFVNLKPMDNSSKGGKFLIIEDGNCILERVIG